MKEKTSSFVLANWAFFQERFFVRLRIGNAIGKREFSEVIVSRALDCRDFIAFGLIQTTTANSSSV
jgi:hypothetical protein